MDHFFIQVIGLRGQSAAGHQDQASLQVSREQWRQTVPTVAKAVAAEGIRVTYPKVYLSNQDSFECAGRVADNYFIFPNGRVYHPGKTGYTSLVLSRCCSARTTRFFFWISWSC